MDARSHISVDLSKRTVLVTGASRGIGAAIARESGLAGARIIAHYSSNREGAERALSEVPDDRKAFVRMDLSVPGSGRELWHLAVKQFAQIDCIVLNAAVNIQTPFEANVTEWDSGWTKTLQVNVTETANLVYSSLPHFLNTGFGIYISFSSWSAQKGSAIPSLAAYAASKAAIKAMMQTVAVGYGRQGISSYILAPGVVNTRMADLGRELRGGDAALNDAMVLGQIAEPDEIARICVALASGDFPNLTGATIDVNGASYIR